MFAKRTCVRDFYCSVFFCVSLLSLDQPYFFMQRIASLFSPYNTTRRPLMGPAAGAAARRARVTDPPQIHDLADAFSLDAPVSRPIAQTDTTTAANAPPSLPPSTATDSVPPLIFDVVKPLGPELPASPTADELMAAAIHHLDPHVLAARLLWIRSFIEDGQLSPDVIRALVSGFVMLPPATLEKYPQLAAYRRFLGHLVPQPPRWSPLSDLSTGAMSLSDAKRADLMLRFLLPAVPSLIHSVPTSVWEYEMYLHPEFVQARLLALAEVLESMRKDAFQDDSAALVVADAIQAGESLLQLDQPFRDAKRLNAAGEFGHELNSDLEKLLASAPPNFFPSLGVPDKDAWIRRYYSTVDHLRGYLQDDLSRALDWHKEKTARRLAWEAEHQIPGMPPGCFARPSIKLWRSSQ